MREFLIQNWITIMFLLSLVGYTVYLIVTKQWEKLRSHAYALMLQAERVYAVNQGSIKFDMVFTEIYNKIPAWLRLFFPPESIKEKLQEWYTLAKDYLSDPP